ncbi:M24 family metallopeptidase [Marinobacter sp. SS21]|uniref:M24 family metallopeptidase n=1 Tax=Marinobacter sp. SS21 TaxID=2979460 RepID=UPI00232B1400|nr:M24 family metallopeptidase [Marinobacter sp. SS21]MDC0661108.1 M24 family metallopeptidase [Marinobacter sp. SS21]
MQKIANFTSAELERFKEVQQLAYECVQAIELQLVEGMTEKEAAGLIKAYLDERGVDSYLHKPFAWFGDRTAFTGFWSDFHFFPTDRKLESGMPVILDVAPTCGGYTADIGYSFSFGKVNPELDRMRQTLLEIRSYILEAVLAGETFKQVYLGVDEIIAEAGFRNAHQVYPRRVLGHRVIKTRNTRYDNLSLFGFSARQLQWLVPGVLQGLVRQPSPLWNDRKESDHPPLPGTWAIEPHLASQDGQVGAKWEEILVITEDTAYWLDEGVPHNAQSVASNQQTVAV